jgi:hypothetical protein
MSNRSALIVATLAAGLCLSAVPARADFCLNAVVDGDTNVFFHFKKKYPLSPDKITAINGKAIFVDGGSVQGIGPAYGEILGLPLGDAGNSLGITFTITTTVGHAAIVLDDNGKMSGGGSVQGVVNSSVIADIVDCATEPTP